MHHTEAEINGHDAEEYEAQKKRVARGINRPNMNARQRQRYAQEIAGCELHEILDSFTSVNNRSPSESTSGQYVLLSVYGRPALARL
jgi:hypothetical protein